MLYLMTLHGDIEPDSLHTASVLKSSVLWIFYPYLVLLKPAAEYSRGGLQMNTAAQMIAGLFLYSNR